MTTSDDALVDAACDAFAGDRTPAWRSLDAVNIDRFRHHMRLCIIAITPEIERRTLERAATICESRRDSYDRYTIHTSYMLGGKEEAASLAREIRGAIAHQPETAATGTEGPK